MKMLPMNIFINSAKYKPLHYNYKTGYATQSLPWQNRTCFQRDQTCRWYHCQQKSQVSQKL